MSETDRKKRRDFLKKSAFLGGAGIAGAALKGGLDTAVLGLPSPSSSSVSTPWDQVLTASCIVFVDSEGSYYVKDTGIGPQFGALIVDTSQITAYGASLGAGTSGATTSTGGIQEGINAVGVGGGGKVHVKAGTYTISVKITDNGYPGITLEGEGESSVIQCAPPFFDSLLGTNSSYWTIRDLCFKGANQFHTGAFANVDIGGVAVSAPVTDCLIYGCTMIGGDQTNVEVSEGSVRCVVANNVLKADASSSGLINIIVTGIGSTTHPTHNIDIIGNICDGTLDSGSSGANILIEGGSTDVNVVGNVCSGSPGQGIAVSNSYGAAGVCNGVRISDNMITNAQAVALATNGQTGGYDAGENIVFSNNYVDSPGSTEGAVAIFSGSNIEIVENHIHNASGPAILIDAPPGGTQYDVSRNFIDSIPASAFGIGVIGVTHVSINENALFTSNGGAVGIKVARVAHYMITGNRVTQAAAATSMMGLDIGHNTAASGVVTNNVLVCSGGSSSHGNFGIYLRSTVTDTVVQGNYVEGFIFNGGIVEASGAGNDYNMILNNNVRKGNASPAIVVSGAHTIAQGNLGYNPVNAITNPFGTATIGLAGSGATPTASTDYAVAGVNIFVTAANSSNKDNSITIKDGAGNIIQSGVATVTALYVPAGYKINWGAFTGTAGAVAVWGA